MLPAWGAFDMLPVDVASFGERLALGCAGAGATWLTAADAGTALLDRAAPGSRRLVRLALGSIIGFAVVGSAVAVLAFFHAAYASVLMGLIATAIIVRARAHVRRLRAVPGVVRNATLRWREAGLFTRTFLVIAGLALTTALIAAALPAVWWDPIAYHLPLMFAALSHATLSFDPNVAQSAFPWLAESASLPAYALAGSAGAALCTLGCGIALAFVAALTADELQPGSGVCCFALITGSALWLWIAPSSYIDVPVAMWAVAALCAPVLLPSGLRPIAAGAICGVLAGACASAKYLGLVLAPFSLCMLLVPHGDRIRRAAGYALAFLAVAAPWYIRTLSLTGDPLYPFLSAAAATGQSIGAVLAHGAAVTGVCGGTSSLHDLLLLPYRLLAEPRAYCGDPGYALRLGAALFVAAPLLSRRSRPYFLLSLALLVAWFATGRQLRFLMAGLSIYAIVVSVGAQSMSSALRPVGLSVLAVLIAFGIATQWAPGLISEASNSLVPGFSYIAGAESGDAYLRRRLETYDAALWLRANGGAAKMYALDDVRDYYFGPNVLWGNPPYPGGVRLDWTAAPEERYRRIAALGCRFMIVNAHPQFVGRSETGVDWKVLAADARRGAVRLVYSANNVFVYSLPATGR
ncbi:MAG TPA: hypothetical protein VID19_04175 [Candidatus Eremiobacteraceae bacterium]